MNFETLFINSSLVIDGGTAAGAINKCTAAFEGRLCDLQTGEVVGNFCRLRHAGYWPARSHSPDMVWSRQKHHGSMDTAVCANSQPAKPGEMVTDTTVFTLKPFYGTVRG